MFVNIEDEETLMPLNTSHGYEPRAGFLAGGGDVPHEDEIRLVGREKREERSAHDFPQTSFLPRDGRADTQKLNYAQKTLQDAGCSHEAVASMTNRPPSQLDEASQTMSEADQAKLKDQLRRESHAHWDSRSIYQGLGVDEAGNYLGLSLTRLNDLLCNMNEHLLVMRRELIEHSHAIGQQRRRNELAGLGFNVDGNRRQLQRASRSVAEASLMLAVHAEKLVDSIMDREDAPAATKMKKICLGTGLLLTGGVAIYALSRYFK